MLGQAVVPSVGFESMPQRLLRHEEMPSLLHRVYPFGQILRITVWAETSYSNPSTSLHQTLKKSEQYTSTCILRK